MYRRLEYFGLEDGCYASTEDADGDGSPIDGCTCDETCGACGYSENPTDADNCVTCASGLALNQEADDGTGHCLEAMPSCTTEGCAIDDLDECTGTDLSNASWIDELNHPCYAFGTVYDSCANGYDCNATDSNKSTPFKGTSSNGNMACPLCSNPSTGLCTQKGTAYASDFCKTSASSSAAAATCTSENSDPWGTGSCLECCDGTVPCLANYDGNGTYYFNCLSSTDCASQGTEWTNNCADGEFKEVV